MEVHRKEVVILPLSTGRTKVRPFLFFDEPFIHTVKAKIMWLSTNIEDMTFIEGTGVAFFECMVETS